jgi:uncharacterized membrane protein
MNDQTLTTEAGAILQRPRARRSDWLVPAGLIVLSIVPAIGGSVRVIQLATGAEITLENGRFFAAPLPILLHIFSAVLFSILGAFQFASGFRRRRPGWHRVAGRILVPAGMICALSGLWMAQFYPWPLFDGVYVYAMRLVVGSAMAFSLIRGTMAILQRDVPRHEEWMMRGYALGLGAGTQVLTHLPYFLFPEMQGELARAICMGAGWAINIGVVEWIISRRRHKRISARPLYV